MLELLAAAAMKQPALRLPAIFGSSMVLQRRSEVRVWGWSRPRARIFLRASWNERPSSTTADRTGAWSVALPTGEASSAETLTISSGADAVRFTNVALGEVWLCSGQSNMWWPLGPSPNMTQIDRAREEVAAAQYPDLRLFTVAASFADAPQTDCSGAWYPCTPQAVHGFSATAYFFGRMLYETLRVPIGLISSAVGGTESELWTSRRKLESIPEFKSRISAAEANAAAQRAEFEAALGRIDPSADQYFRPDWPDASWGHVQVPYRWSSSSLAGFDGIAWYRKRFTVTARQARSGAAVDLGAIDDEDVVYVNGARVGATYDPSSVRSYRIEPQHLIAGQNVIAIRVLDAMGEGGFSGPPESMRVRFGDGTSVALAGDWKFRQGLPIKDLPSRPSPAPRFSRLFNGMIAPLAGFRIRGAIWYQGESNVARGAQYATAFPAMIKDWRAWFKQGDFPFYFVQIAPFPYSRNAASCDLRESQAATLKLVANTGMAVTTDITPDVNDIHPSAKRPVGERLARLALSRTYGPRIPDDESPMYRSMAVDKGVVRIFLNSVSLGLRPTIRQPNEFQIAGADQKFVPAEVRIEGQTLIVWSPSVPQPAAVRYGWTDTATATVFGNSGLPLAPFRTDRWPTVTRNAKW